MTDRIKYTSQIKIKKEMKEGTKMKKMKKMMALVIAVVMMMAMSISASAAGTGTITINNATEGQTYSIYKVFDLESVSGDNYSYKVATGWKNFFTTEGNFSTGFSTGFYNTYFNGKFDGEYLVGFPALTMNDADKAALAKAMLNYAKTNSITATDYTVAGGTTVTFSTLDNGYYLVDSTLGALCSLDTLNNTVEITDKNTLPTMTKTAAKATAFFGEEVEFTLAVKVGVGVDANYVITDTLPTGMTYVANTVSIEGWTEGADYTETYDNATGVLTITLIAAKLDDVENSTVNVTYKATLDSDAVVGGTGNTNTAYLTYKGENTTNTTATVFTYSFDLVKTDTDNNVLSTATFKLYTAETAGTEILLVKDGTTYKYKEVQTGEGAVIEAGKVTIAGLAPGTYWLEEVQSPAGYNKLTARVQVKIESDNLVATVTDGKYVSGGIEVENKTGSLLPDTGGIGTTIFYAAGALLVIGGVVVLVTRKRMENQ